MGENRSQKPGARSQEKIKTIRWIVLPRNIPCHIYLLLVNAKGLLTNKDVGLVASKTGRFYCHRPGTPTLKAANTMLAAYFNVFIPTPTMDGRSH
jgi:hypothetical protein